MKCKTKKLKTQKSKFKTIKTQNSKRKTQNLGIASQF